MYKNLDVIFDALLIAREKVSEIKLVLVGETAKDQKLIENRKIEELGLENQIVDLGVVHDNQLLNLYSEARAFIFPNKGEGFGFPLLEAMAYGCNVIA